jgi:hypothetical protein
MPIKFEEQMLGPGVNVVITIFCDGVSLKNRCSYLLLSLISIIFDTKLKFLAKILAKIFLKS